MKVLTVWFQLLALAAVCVALAGQAAPDKDTTSTSVTIAWVTVTTNGQVNTVKTTYTQTFMSTYSAPTDSVAAGTIGIGSNSGEVGQVRKYSQTTISNGAGVVGSSMFGTLCLVLGLLV